MRNNRTKYIYSNATLLNKSIEAKKAAAINVEETMKQGQIPSTGEILKAFSLINSGTDYVEHSNMMITGSGKWRKTLATSDSEAKEKLNNSLKRLHENNFFNIVSGKETNANDFHEIVKINLAHNNQRIKANENYHSAKESYDYLQNIKKNSGFVYGYDLETTGGKSLDNVWMPDLITEFAFQEYQMTDGKFNGDNIKKTTVMLGINEDKAKELKKRIGKAIENNTIQDDEELRVTAMRFGLYGGDDFEYDKLEGKGYFQVTKFGDANDFNLNDKDKIFRGIDRFVDVYNRTDINANGVKADKAAVAETLIQARKNFQSESAVLIGYNHINHDNPILNKVLYDWAKNDEAYRKAYNLSSFDIVNKQSIDLMGYSRLYVDNNSSSKLHGGKNISNVSGLGRQENIAASHIPHIMEMAEAHKAEDDVTVLMHLALGESEIAKNGDSTLDYMMKGIPVGKNKTIALEPGKHLLKAKSNIGSYDGKHFLNFATDKKGNIFTSDNHVLGNSTEALIESGGVYKEGFNAGYGINAGGYYEIGSIQKLKPKDKLRAQLAEVSPEYAGKELYHVQIKFAEQEGSNGRLADLTQNLFFRSEEEAVAAMSSYFDVTAEKGENGKYHILEGQEDNFDIRRVERNNKDTATILTKVNDEALEEDDLVRDAIERKAQKIYTSRAENYLFNANNTYSKIEDAVGLVDELQDLFKTFSGKETATSEELSYTLRLAQRVARGEKVETLENNVVQKINKVNSKFFEYNKILANGKGAVNSIDSKYDNFSNSLDYINSRKNMLESLLASLKENIPGYNDLPKEHKQELFIRAHEAVIRESTKNFNDNKALMTELRSKPLEASYKEYRDLYQVDYGKIVKDKKIIKKGVNDYGDYVLNLNLSNNNSIYDIIDTSVEALYGDTYNTTKKLAGVSAVSQEQKQKAVGRMFAMLNEDKKIRKTPAFRAAVKKYGFDEHNGFNKEYAPEELGEVILQGMREIKQIGYKEQNGTVHKPNAAYGIIAPEKHFMKSLETSASYNKYINSDSFVSKINDVVKKATENVVLKSAGEDEKSARRVAKDIVEKFYIPKESDIIEAFGNNKNKMTLYKNAKKTVEEAVTRVVHSGSNIKGTTIAVQEDGTLLLMNGKERKVIDNIPKIALNKEQGIIYSKVGAMETEISHKVIYKVNKNTKDVSAKMGTTLDIINGYDYTNAVKHSAYNESTKEAFDKISYGVSTGAVEAMKLPGVNNFRGTSSHANEAVDTSGIFDVLHDLFGDSSSRPNAQVINQDFMDHDLISTMQEHVDKSLNSKNGLELNAEAVRDLIKNMAHINQMIATAPGSTDEFRDIALKGNLNYSNSERKTSKLVGTTIKPYHYTLGALDNTNRPTIHQFANAYDLDVENIKKNAKIGQSPVLAGSVISDAQIDSDNMKKVFGFRETTKDITASVSYVDTNSFKILMDNNFNKVMEKNKIEYNTAGKLDAVKKQFSHLRNSLSIYEQERIMDSRVFEAVHGFKSADIQKLSAGYDIHNIMENLSEKEKQKQVKIIKEHLGKLVKDSDGNFAYKYAIGTHVKRGETILKWSGFAGAESGFGSKMANGIFNRHFFNQKGEVVSAKDITKLINKEKRLFENIDINNDILVDNAIKEVLNKYNLKAQFNVQDMTAKGYSKTMTSSEKGMTHIVYSPIKESDRRIQEFFKEVGGWSDFKNTVVVDDAVHSLIKEYNGKNPEAIEKVFKNIGIKNVEELLSLMKTERHKDSKLLFDDIFQGATHMFANDALGGHGNVGQMYNGTLGKAIDSLSKKYIKDGLNHEEAQSKAVDTVIKTMNSNKDKFHFMSNMELKKDGYVEKFIELENRKGRLYLQDIVAHGDNNLSGFSTERFANLIKQLDKSLEGMEESDRLIAKNVYVANKKGGYDFKEEMFGSFLTSEEEVYDNAKKQIVKGKVIRSTNTRETTRVMVDSETRSGLTQEYLDLKTKLHSLKESRAELKKRYKNKELDKDVYSKKKTDLELEISEVNDHLKTYEAKTKGMKFGDQEAAILDRIVISDNELAVVKKYGNEEALLGLDSIKNKIRRNAAGELEIDEKIKGKKALAPFTEGWKKSLYYDKNAETLLTDENIMSSEYSYLENQYKYLSEKGYKVGDKTAEQLFKNKQAIDAVNFNKGYVNAENLIGDDLHPKAKFEKTNIGNLTFDVDRFSEKNLLVDLGENFSEENRYLAIPGFGKSFNSQLEEEDVYHEAQKKLIRLQNKYNEYKQYQGADRISSGGPLAEKAKLAKERVEEAAQDVKDKLSDVLLSKNGVIHNSSRVMEIQTPTYREKVSGIVSDYSINDVGEGNKFKSHGKNNPLEKMIIDGKSAWEHEKNGGFYDYEIVSKQTMVDAGYFKKETLKKFDMNEDEMEEFLRTHGTLAINDRYPNNRSGSLAPVRSFLGDVSNTQKKIAAVTAAKANGDNDGDSNTAAKLMLDRDVRSVDGASYNLAIVKGGDNARQYAIDHNLMSGEDFDDFDDLQTMMSISAYGENRKWAEGVSEKIQKDMAKNALISTPSEMSSLPGGKSILGTRSFGFKSELPKAKEFFREEERANKVVEKAVEYMGGRDIEVDGTKISIDDLAKKTDEGYKALTVREANSGNLLDKSLTVLKQAKDKDFIDEKTFRGYEAASIHKFTTDRLVTEMMAKTGLAATGSVNVAMNSIKLAAQHSQSVNEIPIVDFLAESFDKAEQKMISQKKRDNPGYDDKLIKNLRNGIHDIFSKNDDQGLKEWFGEYANDWFEEAYKDKGEQVLKAAGKYSENLTPKQGADLMSDVFFGKLKSMANDNSTISLVESFKSVGTNNKRALQAWTNGDIGAAAYEGKSMAATTQGAMGYGDKKRHEHFKEVKSEEQAREQARNKIKDSLVDDAQDFKKAYSSVAQDALEGMSHVKMGGKSLAAMTVGLAAGLLAGGYASGNPLNDKSAQQVNKENNTQPTKTMSIPDFMEKESGYVTGNTQQGYIINIKADTKKGRKHMKDIMAKAAQGTVGGAVSVNVSVKNKNDRGVTDAQIENYLNKYI